MSLVFTSKNKGIWLIMKSQTLSKKCKAAVKKKKKRPKSYDT